MKKTVFMLMMVVSTLTLAAQSGLAQYRYTQGNYSFTVVDEMEFEALGDVYDRELAFMEHTGGRDVATGQGGYEAYRYTQGNYSNALKEETDYSTRMSRGYEPKETFVTGQPGYDEYNYTQKNYSNVILED